MKKRGENLVGSDGRPEFGMYEHPFRNIDVSFLRSYGRSRPGPGSRFITRFRLKKWQFMGACNGEIIFGLAVVDLGYLSNMFAYVYDRKRGGLEEYDIVHPLAANTGFQGSSSSGEVRFSGRNVDVTMINEPDAILLDAAVKKDLRAELKFTRQSDSLNMVTRVGLKGFNYTTKEAGSPVTGNVRVADRVFTIRDDESFGVLDYTVGQLARHTFWNWASGGGMDVRGNRIGFNLVQGVNETGYTENVFWIQDRMIKTDTIDFTYDDRNMMSPWELASFDGKVNLLFYPEGERKKDLNAGLLLSRFHQPFGRFEGYFVDGGERHEIQYAVGFVEEHEAKW